MSMPPRKGPLSPCVPSKPKKPAPFDLSTDRRRRSRLTHLKKELEAADAHLTTQRATYLGWRDATLHIESQQRENFSGLLGELRDMRKKKQDSSHCRFSLPVVEKFHSQSSLDRKEFIVSNVGGKNVGADGHELSIYTALGSTGQPIPLPPGKEDEGQSPKKTYAPPRGMSIFVRRDSEEKGNDQRRRSSAKLPVVGRTPRAEVLRQEKKEQEKRDEEREAQEKKDGPKKIDTSKEVAIMHTKSFLLRRRKMVEDAKTPEDDGLQDRAPPGSNWAYLSPNSSRRGSRRSSSVSPGRTSLTPDNHEDQHDENANTTSARRRRGSGVAFVLEGVETVEDK